MAAVRLARAGASVALFDPSHPREKPCGGGLTGRALALVSDVIDLNSLPHVVVTSATVERPRAHCARRADRSRCHARQFSPRCEPRGVRSRARRRRDSSRRAPCSRKSRRSRPSRGAHDRPDRSRCSTSSTRYWEPTAPTASCARSSHARSRAHNSRWPRASSSTARPARASPSKRRRPTRISVVVSSARSSRGGHLRRRRVITPRQVNFGRSRRNGSSAHGLHRNTRLVPYAWPIPSIGYQSRRDISLGGEGWMLLGDAAGLVDPLTREGIYYALASGQWAADALAATSSSRAASRYADRVLSDIQPELARAARLSRLFFTRRSHHCSCGRSTRVRVFETSSSTW